MQIHNFYADPIPSVRNPLDSIVLSPHTIKSNGFGLAGTEEESSDYQSLLPSPSSCKYYDDDTCLQSNSSPGSIWERWRQVLRNFGRPKS